MRASNRLRRRASGFTLLELLVAMAIFAIVGALAMGGLDAVLGQRELAAKQLDRLHQVQRAVRIITNDFAQLTPRPVRDILGEGQPNLGALKSDCDVSVIVCLSRAGWSNPFWLRPRGELQRIQYRFEDGKLIREYWPAMDRILVTEPRSETLLQDVDGIEIAYQDTNPAQGNSAEWVTHWPPRQTDSGEDVPPPPAIRIRLQLKDWGLIERWVEVPG